MDKKATNIVFNYKIQETQQVQIRQTQTINTAVASKIEQRPLSIPPQQINTVPIETQIKPIQVK